MSNGDVISMTLGSELKRLRLVSGLSPELVEKQAGIRKSKLELLELDRVKNPSASDLQKLAKVYKVDISYLLELAGISSKVAEIALNADPNLTDAQKQTLAKYIRAVRRTDEQK